MADRFFIAPYDKESGWKENVRPWLIPDTAFQLLENAYVYRGRVRKRFGSVLLGIGNDPLISRLRVKIDTTDGSGDTTGGLTTPKNAAMALIVTPAIGQMFSIGTQIFTVNALGSSPPAQLLKTGTATTATFDTTTGAVSITGAAIHTDVYYYPGLPVMGLLTFEDIPNNDERCIAFDTRFAYEYTNGWQRLATGGDAAFWTGTDFQFFWGASWVGNDPSQRAFYVTNDNENEPQFMRKLIGTTWSLFRPNITATGTIVFLNSARILVAFKNMLVALNTWEGPNGGPNLNYPNRARMCRQNASPVATDAWVNDVLASGNQGQGFAVDASTMESIISAEFIKDRLIVFFERSTWELVYTGNTVQPLVWQKINTELGAESSFSTVPFDKVVLTIGSVGIHACNGANVERIDNDIPNVIFEVHNFNQGIERVYGIRDYEAECVYWTIPDTTADADNPYPKIVLVYNYKTATWAYNHDSITAFGYFQPVTSADWDSEAITWDSDVTWNESTSQPLTRFVIAGNQEGYTFLLNRDVPTNASVLQITDITESPNLTLTIINHNLLPNEFLFIQNIVWSDASSTLNNLVFRVDQIVDKDTIIIISNVPITGTYKGGGIAGRVSRINIRTKEYNFYADKARNAYVSRIDFMVDTTFAAQYQVDFFVSTAQIPIVAESKLNGTLMGTSTLDTFPYTVANIPRGVVAIYQYEETATRVWRPLYLQADGEVIQLRIRMNDDQMADVEMRDCDFQMHAIVFHAMPTSNNLQ